MIHTSFWVLALGSCVVLGLLALISRHPDRSFITSNNPETWIHHLRPGVVCSFEAPSFPRSSWSYYSVYRGEGLVPMKVRSGEETVPNRLTPFKFSPSAGIAGRGSPWDSIDRVVLDGKQYAYIQAAGETGFISTMLADLAPSALYQVNFFYALRNYHRPEAPELRLFVTIDDRIIWSQTGFSAGDSWKKASIEFQSFQGTHLLTYTLASSTGEDHSILIDAVLVQKMDIPVDLQLIDTIESNPMIITVSSLSGATASIVSNGHIGHYDTPTGIYVSPGDIIEYASSSGRNSWCKVVQTLQVFQ